MHDDDDDDERNDALSCLHSIVSYIHMYYIVDKTQSRKFAVHLKSTTHNREPLEICAVCNVNMYITDETRERLIAVITPTATPTQNVCGACSLLTTLFAFRYKFAHDI